MGHYKIIKRTSAKGRRETYYFYEDGSPLCFFTRENIRATLEDVASETGRSTKWVGCMVRKFNIEYPLPITRPKTTPSDFAYYNSENFFIQYLRNKGFHVYKPIPISDVDIVFYLNSLGYAVFTPISHASAKVRESAGEQTPALAAMV